MATYENVDYGSGDGALFGQSATSKIGFYGKAPLAQVSLTQQATTATTTQLRAELTALQNALHNLGIVVIT
jgi:ribonuclease HI